MNNSGPGWTDTERVLLDQIVALQSRLAEAEDMLMWIHNDLGADSDWGKKITAFLAQEKSQ